MYTHALCLKACFSFLITVISYLLKAQMTIAIRVKNHWSVITQLG